MAGWPPRGYTVLRVYADGHRAELLADEDDDVGCDEAEWRDGWLFALAFARAYGEETEDGESLVVAFVPWAPSESA